MEQNPVPLTLPQPPIEPQQTFTAPYAAFFAPRTHKFETVDFRLPASLSNLQQYFPVSVSNRHVRARQAGLLGLLVGTIFALFAFAIDQLTRALTLAIYRPTQTLFRTAFWPAAGVFLLLSLILALVPAALVVYLAPLGAGSGIPELKSYLNGVKIPGFLALESLLVKLIGIAFSLSSGLICGKQGPMIHAGAITGAGLSQMASSRFSWRLRGPHFRFLRTEAWKRDFCTVGAAVGVAVAFGSPMGAWMWVYEDASTHWSWDLGIITLAASLTGAVIVRVLNHVAAGLPGVGFGAFTLTQFGKLVTPFEGNVYLFKDVPAFVLLAVIGGIVGAIHPFVSKRITLFRYKRITNRVPRILEALLVAGLTSIFRLLIPYFADDCRPIDSELQAALSAAPLGDYSRFTCPESQFSPWAAVIYNPTDTVVRGLLFSRGKDLFPAAAVAVAFIYFFFFLIWTYGLAVPGGVFFPAFLLGSVYGRLVGLAVQAIFPSRTDISLTAYAFIGSVSALGGITRTISVAVIALEATGGNNGSFAAVFVSIVAKLVADFLYSTGIYDLHVNLKGIPFLSSHIPKLEQYAQLRVYQLMESSVIGVRRLSRLGGLVHMLKTNDHHAFPVFVKVKPEDRLKISKANSGSRPSGMDESLVDSDFGSQTSVLEAQLDRQDSAVINSSKMTSLIMTPSQYGMQATIFDEGNARLVQLTEAGEVNVLAVGTPVSKRMQHVDSTSRSIDTGGVSSGTEGSSSIPNFELMGTIDRGTLLAIVKHECDKAVSRRDSDMVTIDASADVVREDMDAAWPNCGRLKGNAEKELLQRVIDLDIGSRLVDLRVYVDPDPLLMSDRAISMAAYKLFRSSGARHILVTNMRSGRVNGIMTRKDVLPESVEEVFNKVKDGKQD